MIYKPFLNFVTEEDGRSLRVLNGIVTSQAYPYPIPETYDGWMDILISWERDMKRGGIVRSFSTPIEAVGDMAHILRHIYLNENVERKISLLIKRLTLDLTPTTYNFIYRYLYKGQLDLTTLKASETGVTVNIMEGGISRLLKANEGTQFEIDVDLADNFIFIKMDGMFLNMRQNFATQSDLILSNGEIIGTFEGSKEGNATGLATFSIAQQHQPADFTISNEYFAVTTDAFNMRVRGRIVVDNVGSAPNDVSIVLKGHDSVNVTLASTSTFPATLEFDVVVPTVAGRRYFFCLDKTNPFGAVRIAEGELSLEIDSRAPTSYIKALKPYDLYSELCDLVIGVDSLRSSALLVANSNLAVTCGDALRGLANSKIKTKFTEFFDSFQAILNAGLGIENKTLTLEAMSRYFDASNPVDLGAVKNLIWYPAADLMSNTIKIGYPATDIEDDANGKYATNTTQIYGSPLTAPIREYMRVSNYVTDPFLIENIRVNFNGKDTADSSTDNNNVILNVEPEQDNLIGVTAGFVAADNIIVLNTTNAFLAGQVISVTGSAAGNDGLYTILGVSGLFALAILFVSGPAITDEGSAVINVTYVRGQVFRLKRPAYTNIGDPDDFGVPSPSTIFNLEQLTPKRMLLANGPSIRPMYYGLESSSLRFLSEDRNRNLKTVLAGVTVDEDADVPIVNLGAPLYKPIYFEFGTEVPVDLVDLLEANTNRCFTFTWNDNTYKGFLIKAALAPVTGKEQTFKLLCAPDVDLSTLVNP